MLTATYSPEDNKLRLYSGSRLDDETYKKLKAAGFKWAPKQAATAGVDCLMVAPKWTMKREDLLLELVDEIEDEDYSPEERAADRAERFGGYRNKRRAEAGGLADAFEAGPAAFGHQNSRRAERQAARHDRKRTGAVSQWSKAEYWQERTEGVIAHALFKSSPHVRRGRVKDLEAEIASIEANYTPASDPPEISEQANREGEIIPFVWCGKGRGGRWVAVRRLEQIKESYSRWLAHCNFRLAYERAMLAEEGGIATDAEMVAGGWLKGHRIAKVNKSATGKVSSITTTTGHILSAERLGEDDYRAPTAEELAEFKTEQKAAKAAKKASTPKAPPLVNPTVEDAQRLQDHWNAQGRAKHDKAKAERRLYGDFQPSKIRLLTQAEYSAASKRSYSHLETIEVCENGFRPMSRHWDDYVHVPVAFKVRKSFGGGSSTLTPDRIVVITDKPQKPLPLDWKAIEANPEPKPAVEAGMLS